MWMAPTYFVDTVTNFLILLHVTHSMKVMHSTENISLQFQKECQESNFSIINRTQKRYQIYKSCSAMKLFTKKKDFLSHIASFGKNHHRIESVDKRGDSIDHEDVVKKQYSSLPYPDVAQATLDREYDHYNVYMKQHPYYTVPTLKLGNLNHFLYEGKFDFR